MPCGAELKNLAASAEDKREVCSIPRSGISPGVGNGNPLQYPHLGNPMVGRAWRATVHGLTKSQTLLSNFHLTSHFRVGQ